MKQIWNNILVFCKKITGYTPSNQATSLPPVSCFAQRTVSEATPCAHVAQGLASYLAPQGSPGAYQLHRRQTRSERDESIDKLKQQLLECTDPHAPTTHQLIMALLKKNAIESLSELINTKPNAQAWCLVATDMLMQQPQPSYELALRLCKQHLALPVYFRLTQHALNTPDGPNEVEKISENVFYYYRIYHSSHLAACNSHKQLVYVAAAHTCAQNRAWQDAFHYAQKCAKHPQVWTHLLEALLNTPDTQDSFNQPAYHTKAHWSRIFWEHTDPVGRKPWQVVEQNLNSTPQTKLSIAAVSP
jgi:hypothetical protein